MNPPGLWEAVFGVREKSHLPRTLQFSCKPSTRQGGMSESDVVNVLLPMDYHAFAEVESSSLHLSMGALHEPES